MGDPYRDPDLSCPACQATLRSFQDRLCCDACNGIFLEHEDLERSVGEVSAVAATVIFIEEQPGERMCPKCVTKMIRCQCVVEVEGKRANPKPELDRCDKHGIWFDELELAKVFQAAHGKVWPPAYAGGGGRLIFGKAKF